MGMNDEHEESAYRKARQSYGEIIEKFGSQLVAHKFFPDKYKPINRDKLISEFFRVLQTYCKTAHPSLNVNNECAFKLAEKIESDKKMVPEAKTFILSFFSELEFHQLPSKFSESAQRTKKE